jgi:hypothetical protein
VTQVDLAEVGRAYRTPGLVVLEGFHAVKHAIRFGAEILGAWTADPGEVEALRERLAPDVRIPVQVVDAAALRAVVPRPSWPVPATSSCSRTPVTSATWARRSAWRPPPAPRA